jgi:formamidopyrimidine-DNA glycosylase
MTERQTIIDFAGLRVRNDPRQLDDRFFVGWGILKYNRHMPELPEVENLRLGLEKKIVGQKIKSVVVTAPKLVSGSGNLRKASKRKVEEFISGLTGEVISKIERRAKNLIFHFKSGKILLVHLKMSGQFSYKEGKTIAEGGHPFPSSGMSAAKTALSSRSTYPGSMNSGFRVKPGMTGVASLPGKHTHIIFELSRGTLYYNDVRTFGYLLYFPSAAEFVRSGHFNDVGPEPLSKEFSEKYFAGALKNKKTNIKALLLGQSAVAGLGNIYADETLFDARIRPTKSAFSLRKEEVKRLYSAIKKILLKAIKLGGSSIATYRLLDETRGNFAREHKVYGRGGEKCLRCGKKLISKKIAGRTAIYCLNCQK